MPSVWGRTLKISLWGESHGTAVGAVLDGFPQGFAIDDELIASYMQRRAGGGELATARRESDNPRFLSGVKEGYTTGAPISILIENTSARSADYGGLTVPRPGHADYPAYVKFGGYAEHRGGGHFSGRLTAPLTAAGAICAAYLSERHGIEIAAHIQKAGAAEDRRFDPVTVTASDLKYLRSCVFPTLSPEAGVTQREIILEAKARGDSVGAILECAAAGLPVGLGSHAFGSVEGIISSVMFGIPAVKGIEFGDGFGMGGMYGSRANDPYRIGADGKPAPVTNHAGGVLGGMTTGMPLIFSLAFKPTPSIFSEQESVDLERNVNVPLRITGRHDPCVAVRAVPVVECCCALALTDIILTETK